MLEFVIYLLCSILLLWQLQPPDKLSPDQIKYEKEYKRNQKIQEFYNNVEKLKNFAKNNKKSWFIYDARERGELSKVEKNSIRHNDHTHYDMTTNNYTTYTYFDTKAQVYRREYIIYWDDFTIADNCGIFPVLFKDICVIRNLHSNPKLNTPERPQWKGKTVKQLTHAHMNVFHAHASDLSNPKNPYLINQKCDQFDDQLILMKITFHTVVFTVYFQIILTLPLQVAT